MKKYLRLICDTCNRTTDKLVDNTRVTPDRCTITFKCLGRLFPVEYRSNGEITTAPEIGIVDWYPRGGSVGAGSVALTESSFIDTSTGANQQLVIGIRLPSLPATTATAVVTFHERIEVPKDYKQFTFRRDNAFTTISGVESGTGQKVLKFRAYDTNPDLVEVYLNGVKLEEGTGPNDFQVDDGTGTTPSPPNTITFNTQVLPVGTFQVDVIVSKVPPPIERIITFRRHRDDANYLSLGPWENVSHVERLETASTPGQEALPQNYYLFSYDVKNGTTFRKDTILYPAGTISVTGAGNFGAVALDKAEFFFARKPYTKIDRYPDITAPLTSLGADRDYLKYHSVGGELQLQVTETALAVKFPPARLVKFNVESTVKTQVPGNDEQLVVDGKLIVGPDT